MSKLTANQSKAITALLTSPTLKDAAESVGVRRATIYNWLKLPEFADALKSAQDETLKAHAALLAGMLEDAAKVYSELLLRSEDEAVRLRAADSVHKAFDSVSARLLSEREAQEFEARLAALEAALQ